MIEVEEEMGDEEGLAFAKAKVAELEAPMQPRQLIQGEWQTLLAPGLYTMYQQQQHQQAVNTQRALEQLSQMQAEHNPYLGFGTLIPKKPNAKPD